MKVNAPPSGCHQLPADGLLQPQQHLGMFRLDGLEVPPPEPKRGNGLTPTGNDGSTTGSPTHPGELPDEIPGHTYGNKGPTPVGKGSGDLDVGGEQHKDIGPDVTFGDQQ